MNENRLQDMVEDIKMPEDMKNSLIANCSQKKRSGDFLYRHAKGLTAIAIVCILAVGGTSVAACTSILMNRMESMSDTEVKEFYGFSQNLGTSDLFSRSFTTQETELFSKLEKKYVKGEFPDGQITVVNNEKYATEDKVYFLSEKAEFVLPDRSLTKEEILEVIDHYYKFDYSISRQSKNENDESVVKMNEMDEKEQALAQKRIDDHNGVSKDQIQKQADKDMKDVMDIEDISHFSKMIEAVNELDQIEYGYSVTYSLAGPVNDVYVLDYDAISGKLERVYHGGASMDSDKLIAVERMEKNVGSHEDAARTFMEEKMNVNLKGAKVYYKASNQDQQNCLSFVYITKENNTYEVSWYYDSDTIRLVKNRKTDKSAKNSNELTSLSQYKELK